MCVIKTIKEGSFSSREILEMWNNNPDGAGIGVLDKSNTLIKPFKSKDFKEFQTNLDLVFLTPLATAFIRPCSFVNRVIMRSASPSFWVRSTIARSRYTDIPPKLLEG